MQSFHCTSPRLYLYKEDDEHGEDGEGEAQDVEERDGDKGLPRVQAVGRVDQEVGGEAHQRHLQFEEGKKGVDGRRQRAKRAWGEAKA